MRRFEVIGASQYDFRAYVGQAPRRSDAAGVCSEGSKCLNFTHSDWQELRGKVTIIHENESTYVPKSTEHRLENPGKVPLEMIEVQNGEYVGEDDIVRFSDAYGRSDRSK